MLLNQRKIHRLNFQIFDGQYIGTEEKEVRENILRFRDYIGELIKKRKEQLKDPSFTGSDFLTLLLTDELFKDNESLIKDECATFFVAAT